VPGPLRGLGITFIVTGLMGIAFMSFMGINSEIGEIQINNVKVKPYDLISIPGSRHSVEHYYFLCCYPDPGYGTALRKIKTDSFGKVTLTINDENKLSVQPGSTVLTTLSENSIYLPSACGGGGTCAQCKCQVLEGGGSILPTEKDFFTRREQIDQWRLGCQVKIREDMKIRVPEEVLGIKKWECEVISNKNVATFIKEFVVKLPEGEIMDFQSGGYIQIDVPKLKLISRILKLRNSSGMNGTNSICGSLK
jgi:ferredoxin